MDFLSFSESETFVFQNRTAAAAFLGPPITHCLPQVIGARNFGVNSSSNFRRHFPFTGNEIQGRLVVVMDSPSADPGWPAELPRLQALGCLFIKAYEPCSIGRDLQKFGISLQFTSL
jgi:hypothetical protein